MEWLVNVESKAYCFALPDLLVMLIELWRILDEWGASYELAKLVKGLCASFWIFLFSKSLVKIYSK